MIELDVDFFFLLYLGLGFLLLGGFWLYSDIQDKRRIEPRASKVIFHCIKCSQIYVGRHGSEECDCPQCGFKNGRLRF